MKKTKVFKADPLLIGKKEKSKKVRPPCTLLTQWLARGNQPIVTKTLSSANEGTVCEGRGSSKESTFSVYPSLKNQEKENKLLNSNSFLSDKQGNEIEISKLDRAPEDKSGVKVESIEGGLPDRPTKQVGSANHEAKTSLSIAIISSPAKYKLSSKSTKGKQRKDIYFTCDSARMNSNEESEYEIQRRKNIEENNRMLRELGLTSLKNASVLKGSRKPPVNKQKRPRSDLGELMTPALPSRRSMRIAGASIVNSYSIAPLAEKSDICEDENEELCVGTFVDLRVKSVSNGTIEPSAKPSSSRLLDLFEGFGHKVYSIDISVEKKLLLATGGQGLLSIFRLPSPNCPADDISELGDDIRQNSPLITSKLHKSWIGDAQFMNSDDSGTVKLLTSSNDGTLMLSEYCFESKSEKGGAYVEATKEKRDGNSICRLYALDSSTLHTKGIFSMHFHSDKIITGSKDGSVGLCRIRESKMEVVAVFNEHSSVVKNVRLHQTRRLGASVGNDCKLLIYDIQNLRKVQDVQTEHCQNVNSVRFNPECENELFTSSFDKQLIVYDLRKLNSPLCKLNQHHKSKPGLVSPEYVSTRNALCKGVCIAAPASKDPWLHCYPRTSSEMPAIGQYRNDLVHKLYLGFSPSAIAYSSSNASPMLFAAHGTTRIWGIQI
eukprot:Nk52_evm2s1360 gene=Nk52_evmTU2s1360